MKIAKTCHETAPKKRAAWLKEKHGLGVNRAAQIFSVAFPSGPSWDQPDALLDLLWKEPEGRAIYEAVAKMVRKEFPTAIMGPRKTFVSFSRGIQFAGIIPLKGGKAELGLPSAAQRKQTPQPDEAAPFGPRSTPGSWCCPRPRTLMRS